MKKPTNLKYNENFPKSSGKLVELNYVLKIIKDVCGVL